MKTLSLLQPWASLVVMGAKKIETRSWRTAHRGELLIHASLGKKGGAMATQLPFKKYITHFTALPFGAIIGRVRVDDIIPVEALQLSDIRLNALTLEEKAFGDYGRGRYAWMLSEPLMFNEPVFIRGSLQLWEYTGELTE